MQYNVYPRGKRTLAEHHIDVLVEVLSELLAVPELSCVEPEEILDSTRQVIAKARSVRSAVLDEFTPLEGAL